MKNPAPGQPAYKVVMERQVGSVSSTVLIYVDAPSRSDAIKEARTGMNTTHRCDCDLAWKVTAISNRPVPVPKA